MSIKEDALRQEMGCMMLFYLPSNVTYHSSNIVLEMLHHPDSDIQFNSSHFWDFQFACQLFLRSDIGPY